MRLLGITFSALLVIACAGTSIAQSQEARKPHAEDVYQRFFGLPRVC
jgi:hypothetical protein